MTLVSASECPHVARAFLQRRNVPLAETSRERAAWILIFSNFHLKICKCWEYLPVRILIVICRDRNSITEASLWRENTSRLILIRGNFILTKLVFFFVSLFVIGRVKVAGMKINSIEIRPVTDKSQVERNYWRFCGAKVNDYSHETCDVTKEKSRSGRTIFLIKYTWFTVSAGLITRQGYSIQE